MWGSIYGIAGGSVGGGVGHWSRKCSVDNSNRVHGSLFVMPCSMLSFSMNVSDKEGTKNEKKPVKWPQEK